MGKQQLARARRARASPGSPPVRKSHWACPCHPNELLRLGPKSPVSLFAGRPPPPPTRWTTSEKLPVRADPREGGWHGQAAACPCETCTGKPRISSGPQEALGLPMPPRRAPPAWSKEPRFLVRGSAHRWTTSERLPVRADPREGGWHGQAAACPWETCTGKPRISSVCKRYWACPCHPNEVLGHVVQIALLSACLAFSLPCFQLALLSACLAFSLPCFQLALLSACLAFSLPCFLVPWLSGCTSGCLAGGCLGKGAE